MKQQFRRTALASLIMVMSTAALVACGGGDDPAPAAAGSSGGGSATAFATPTSATATTEGGFISTYNYVESTTAPKSQTIIAASHASGVVTYGHTLGGSQGWAGTALRFFAPGNADATGTTPFNASSYSNLKIKMATTNAADTSIVVMLHPFTAAGAFDANGCAYKATLTLTAPTTSTEYSIALNNTAFTYTTGGSCAATAPAFSGIAGNLYGIDVRNEGNADGTHDLKVESIKFQ